MKKTYEAKQEEIKRQCFIVDAKEKILGRLAVKVAVRLRGKHKPMYTPNIDTGDNVIVINASKVRVTGRKLEQKVYQRYSGYPDGQIEVKLKDMLAKRPATVIELAVRRMLPGGPLGRKMLKKLRVYAGENHPHKAQNPVVLEV